MKLLAACCFVLVCSPTTFAGVYKWTDDNGQVHFGDSPPLLFSSSPQSQYKRLIFNP
ncbi:MAG: DUF4124 domain-containing protein, partial [Thalassolituus sp.]